MSDTIPVPLNLSPEEADERLPVGFINPFPPDSVPDNWVPFDGRVLFGHDYPSLYDSLMRVAQVWERLGGKISANAIVMPGPLTDEEANDLVWGMKVDPPVPMTLALKVRRRVQPVRD